MTWERENYLFNAMLGWVFDHTVGYDEYAEQLKEIGFTKNEIIEELESNCGVNSDDIINTLF